MYFYYTVSVLLWEVPFAIFRRAQRVTPSVCAIIRRPFPFPSGDIVSGRHAITRKRYQRSAAYAPL